MSLERVSSTSIFFLFKLLSLTILRKCEYKFAASVFTTDVVEIRLNSLDKLMNIQVIKLATSKVSIKFYDQVVLDKFVGLLF